MGDSISMGYTEHVVKRLTGIAQVHRSPGNAMYSANGLKHLKAWLGNTRWDVIHFNWGIWDLHYLTATADPLQPSTDAFDPDGVRRTTTDQYEANLRAIIAQLRETGAKLIWAAITPLPDEPHKAIRAGEEVEYNARAARVMREHQIPVNDLYGYTRVATQPLQPPGDVHFTAEGYAQLGDKVAAAIANALGVQLVPDATRDTITPVYDSTTLPYTWDEIRAGRMPISPVHWERYTANPVIAEGMNPRAVWWDASTIRVFYGRRGPGQGIYYVDVRSEAPQTIINGPVGPIIRTGPAGSYDDDWLIAPEPVRLSPRHLRMYYSSKQSGKPFFAGAWSLSFAESNDNGVTWKKYEGNPILTAGTERWECGATGFCSVEKDGAAWRMWYLGTDDTGGADACKQVGFATSDDGIHWQRYAHNPVIPVNPDLACERGAIAVPRVIHDGKFYKVWYCCYEKNVTYAIGQAESFDGIRWFRSPGNPVMTASGQGWDNDMVTYPTVIRAGDRYLMWYSGNGYGNAGIGMATAAAPSGRWLYRIGPGPKPGPEWSAWQPVGDAAPPRAGYIQLAVCTGISEQ